MLLTPTDADERAIGPRTGGAYYGNTTGLYEVIAVHHGLEAQRLLGKDATRGRGPRGRHRTRNIATERLETHRQPWSTTDHLARWGR
ncbi:hypothetical protein [Streptomyces lydicus]|uniref:hypothetical protein n=1 Tax=Streptomyces lydicus TaxID=47763 RepID=UPI00379F9539